MVYWSLTSHSSQYRSFRRRENEEGGHCTIKSVPVYVFVLSMYMENSDKLWTDFSSVSAGTPSESQVASERASYHNCSRTRGQCNTPHVGTSEPLYKRYARRLLEDRKTRTSGRDPSRNLVTRADADHRIMLGPLAGFEQNRPDPFAVGRIS